jgi:hypothetical protein
VNTLRYQIVSPVRLETQKKKGRTAERDERLTEGEEKCQEVEEDKRKLRIRVIYVR